MKLIILDEDLEELSKVDFINNFEKEVYKICPDVPNISKKEEVLFNHFEFGIGVFSPTKELDDFYISFLNEAALFFTPYTSNDLKGTLVSESILSFNKSSVVLTKIKEVYLNNQPKTFYLEFYNDKFLFKRLKFKIFKLEDYVYLFGKDETDYNIFSMKKNRFIEDYPEAIAIIQDNKIVKCNKKYLEIEAPKNYKDIINKEIDYEYLNIKTEQIKQLNNAIKNILNQKSFIESFPFEITANDKILHYFNINLIYILYNNKPAVIILFEDITKERLYLNQLEKSLDKSLSLECNLKQVQKITRTAMAIKYSGKMERSDSFYDILKIDPIKYKNHNDLAEFILKEDIPKWKNNYKKCSPKSPESKTTIRCIDNEGNLLYVNFYIVCTYDNEGKEIGCVYYYQDITEEITYEKELENTLNKTLEVEDSLERIQSASKTFISYFYDLQNISWTPEVYNILEINKNYKNKNYNILEDFITPEDLITRRKIISQISNKNPDVTITQRIKTGKGNLKYIKTVMHYDYDNKGNFIKGTGFNQDITEEITYEKQLQETLEDKKILLKEVHHRVKNNLQIILSLINLNLDFNVDTKNTLLNTQNHLYAMALIHEKLYGSDSLSEVDMKEYIKSLVSALIDLYDSDIKIHINIDQINLHMEQSIPIGLIINELVTNTIKYAFPNKKEGNLYIDFQKENNHYRFIYKDDGIGLPENIDIENLTSLGLIVVTNLTIQIGGTFSILDCKGTGYKIEF